MGNIDGCATAVFTWWPKISEALFSYEGTAAAICVGAGYCTKRIPYGQQDVTCAECETFLGKIATLLETPDFAAIVAAALGSLLRVSASRICTDNGCTY